MKSITYGDVELNDIAEIIREFIEKKPDYDYNLIVGTDSQNFSTTKIVNVIALQRVGRGGIFFYEITNVRKISNIKQKLLTETQMSLDLAVKILDELDKLFDRTDWDYTKHLSFSIHVDAGDNGPTKKVIPEIVAYIRSFGFDAVTKPDSFVASSIADKYSK